MKKKKLKVLIIGSHGFIGMNLFYHLQERYKVYGLDRAYGKSDDIFGELIELNIKKVDVVVHLAAITNVSESFKNPENVFTNNVLATAKVAYLCQKYRKKLIYTSSAAVYNRKLSPYAETKALAEDIVKGISTPKVILRLSNVFGPGMNPNSGSIMYNFLTAEELVVYGDGEQTRDFIHVKDVVSIIESAFGKKWDNAIVDVGTGQAYTVNYIVGLFAYYRGLPVIYMPPRREIRWSVADTYVLNKLYKKDLMTNLEKDIENLIVKQKG